METQLEQKARETIARYDMLHKGDSIAVGVSGGADSVALFDLLCTIRDSLDISLTVCHVNHSLRGAESLRDAEFVRELARKGGAGFRLLTVDAAAEALKEGRGVEEASRDIRYGFFSRVAGSGGKIATAHTLDDSVETFLFRLARGTGAQGLRGIPAVRGNIIRPLLECTRAEVEHHLRTRGLPWVEDSTNGDDGYARNRIRHHVLPGMKAVNPAALYAVAGAMERISALQELAEEMAAEAEPRLRRGGGYDAAGILELPRAAGDCLLLRILDLAGVPRSSRAVEAMRGVLFRGGEICLGNGMVFRRWRGTAALRPWEPPPAPVYQTVPFQEARYPLLLHLKDGKTLKADVIPAKELQKPEKINKRDLNFFADYAKISNNAILRQKQDGDRIALPERGSRLLKKLCQEAGIPPARRSDLLVLCDGEGPFWAEGFGFDRRVISLNAENYLTLTVVEEG